MMAKEENLGIQSPPPTYSIAILRLAGNFG
jgi:hypothetical protein